eukprot:CAMPEP_0178769056 /NCGR_PEP_ID=MMETSP0744-20121128/20607_1 /TAXON_ID=913974 /ORGANISM="Nitzschia punctata, Strain CCMP561" /LENGTH=49 /DNA_ID=CAMNT_0020425245 /DNA_START=121 /DNA_END=270 /DNA_ORIENTATION=-
MSNGKKDDKNELWSKKEHNEVESKKNDSIHSSCSYDIRQERVMVKEGTQ